MKLVRGLVFTLARSRAILVLVYWLIDFDKFLFFLVVGLDPNAPTSLAVLGAPACCQVQTKTDFSSAHACSEIGLKWFLFALHDLGTALGFVCVFDFFGYFVSPRTQDKRANRN